MRLLWACPLSKPVDIDCATGVVLNTLWHQSFNTSSSIAIHDSINRAQRLAASDVLISQEATDWFPAAALP